MNGMMKRALTTAFALTLGTTASAEISEPLTLVSAKALVAAQKPDGVNVEEIDLDGHSAKVIGTGESNAHIAQFLNNLDGSGRFDTVDLASVNSTTRGNRPVLQYQIYVEIK
jgi:Tfp pilus assembly protein PilN